MLLWTPLQQIVCMLLTPFFLLFFVLSAWAKTMVSSSTGRMTCLSKRTCSTRTGVSLWDRKFLALALHRFWRLNGSQMECFWEEKHMQMWFLICCCQHLPLSSLIYCILVWKCDTLRAVCFFFESLANKY